MGVGSPLDKNINRTVEARGGETIHLTTQLRSRSVYGFFEALNLEKIIAHPLAISLRLGEAVVSYGECLANVGPGDSAMTLRCLHAKGTCLFEVSRFKRIVETPVCCMCSLSSATSYSRVIWCTCLVPVCGCVCKGFGGLIWNASQQNISRRDDTSAACVLADAVPRKVAPQKP